VDLGQGDGGLLGVEVLYVEFVAHFVLVHPEGEGGGGCEGELEVDGEDLIGHGSRAESVQNHMSGIDVGGRREGVRLGYCDKEAEAEDGWKWVHVLFGCL